MISEADQIVSEFAGVSLQENHKTVSMGDEDPFVDIDNELEGLREFESENEGSLSDYSQLEFKAPRKKFEKIIYDFDWSPYQGFKIGPYHTRGGKRNHLGKGAISDVYKGVDSSTKSTVAIKVIHIEKLPSLHHAKLIEQESEFLRKHHYKHIIRLIESGKLSMQYNYMILEYCNMGDLDAYLFKNGALPKDKAKSFMLQLLDVMKYLQSLQVIHRDIKPANVLIQQENDALTLKLADFSLVTECKSNVLYTDNICGSPIYWAPEIWREGKFSYKSEVYALGLCLFQMLFRKLPWKLDFKTIEEIQRTKFTKLDIPENTPEDTKNLLLEMLSPDFNKRLSLDRVVSHPWFN